MRVCVRVNRCNIINKSVTNVRTWNDCSTNSRHYKTMNLPPPQQQTTGRLQTKSKAMNVTCPLLLNKCKMSVYQMYRRRLKIICVGLHGISRDVIQVLATNFNNNLKEFFK